MISFLVMLLVEKFTFCLAGGKCKCAFPVYNKRLNKGKYLYGFSWSSFRTFIANVWRLLESDEAVIVERTLDGSAIQTFLSELLYARRYTGIRDPHSKFPATLWDFTSLSLSGHNVTPARGLHTAQSGQWMSLIVFYRDIRSCLPRTALV